MEISFLGHQPQAIPLVAAWYVNQWGYLKGVDSLESEIDKLSHYLHTDQFPLILLAIHQEEVVGACQLKFREMDLYPDKVHWLGGVYVAAPQRGRGVARQLLARAVEVATGLGAPTLYLQTERLDGGLYARLGWQPLEQVNYHGVEVLVMERPLQS